MRLVVQIMGCYTKRFWSSSNTGLLPKDIVIQWCISVGIPSVFSTVSVRDTFTLMPIWLTVCRLFPMTAAFVALRGRILIILLLTVLIPMSMACGSTFGFMQSIFIASNVSVTAMNFWTPIGFTTPSTMRTPIRICFRAHYDKPPSYGYQTGYSRLLSRCYGVQECTSPLMGGFVCSGSLCSIFVFHFSY